LNKSKQLLAVGLVAALGLAACGSDDEPAAEEPTTEAPSTDAAPADTEAPATPSEGEAVKTCLVTGLAGIDDQSFNASAWQGVQDAMASGAATEDSFFLESGEASQYQANVDQMVDQGCQHIVTVGFDLGEVTATNATANPDIKWTMIDNVLSDPDTFEPLGLTNVRELVYQTDEAAFAAGYLAAGVSKTGVLCTYGGANFPTVAIFMDGFTRGAQHYNEVKGTDVSVLGWDVDAQDGTFTGSFTDMGLARSQADSLFQEDCDMILPVGGAINLPAGDAINDLGIEAALIGVDSDAFFAMDQQYASLWLTTIEKKIADFVAQSVAEDADGSWTAGPFVGNLANGGVGLAPYHDWDDRVSDELRGEVEQLLADIAAGDIKADYVPVGY
jgi:basic membrane protein A